MIRFIVVRGLVIANITIIIIDILDEPIIILQRGTQTRLKIFDHIIIMNMNRFYQWQFKQQWPQT
jgi:hypothetical protein